jgi:hypothetical protein
MLGLSARLSVSISSGEKNRSHRRQILLRWRKINMNSTDQGPFGVPKITGSNTNNPTKNDKSRISSSSSPSNRRCFTRQLDGSFFPSDGGDPERNFHWGPEGRGRSPLEIETESRALKLSTSTVRKFPVYRKTLNKTR